MRTLHGLYLDPTTGKKARLYHIWEDMKSRCNNPRNRRYKDYGGRGIRLCSEWETDYASFYGWSMLNGYTSVLTIDRTDVNGNYGPLNCKWATQKEQCNNRRTNKLISWNGETLTQTQWAARLGAGKHLIKTRIKRGWTIERALTTPK